MPEVSALVSSQATPAYLKTSRRPSPDGLSRSTCCQRLSRPSSCPLPLPSQHSPPPAHLPPAAPHAQPGWLAVASAGLGGQHSGLSSSQLHPPPGPPAQPWSQPEGPRRASPRPRPCSVLGRAFGAGSTRASAGSHRPLKYSHPLLSSHGGPSLAPLAAPENSQGNSTAGGGAVVL